MLTCDRASRRIAAYYCAADLAGLPELTRGERLRSIYARYVLPAALAASLGRNALAYRLYRRMIDELSVELAPKQKRRESQSRALSV